MRLSTVGIGVLDGANVEVAEGDGVSVKGSVGVTDAVSVAVGSGVDDFAGGFVAVGTEDDGTLQATNINIKRTEKTRFRLIGGICVPFWKIVLNNCERSPDEKISPFGGTGIVKPMKEALLSFVIAAAFAFFF